jgi:hypothetical protein
MRICNNTNGLPDCYGGCFKDGLCISKCRCEDSLVVNEELIKTLMKESGRYNKIINKWRNK